VKKYSGFLFLRIFSLSRSSSKTRFICCRDERYYIYYYYYYYYYYCATAGCRRRRRRVPESPCSTVFRRISGVPSITSIVRFRDNPLMISLAVYASSVHHKTFELYLFLYLVGRSVVRLHILHNIIILIVVLLDYFVKGGEENTILFPIVFNKRQIENNIILVQRSKFEYFQLLLLTLDNEKTFLLIIVKSDTVKIFKVASRYQRKMFEKIGRSLFPLALHCVVCTKPNIF